MQNISLYQSPHPYYHLSQSFSSWFQLPSQRPATDIIQSSIFAARPTNEIYVSNILPTPPPHPIMTSPCCLRFTCYMFVSSLHSNGTLMPCNVFYCQWHLSLLYISLMHKYDKPFNRMIFHAKQLPVQTLAFICYLANCRGILFNKSGEELDRHFNIIKFFFCVDLSLLHWPNFTPPQLNRWSKLRQRLINRN